jgi:uncharacterized protein YndB with AHSA1/START domain
MADINLETSIAATADQAFEALSTSGGVAKWWTTDAKSGAVQGSVSEFGFGNRAVVMRMRVVAAEPGGLLRWECLDQPSDWTGTVLEWRLTPEGDRTRVGFTQTNWKAGVDGAKYAARWEHFLGSLRAYLETGRGTPES